MPIAIGTEGAGAIRRADIEVAGLEHAGASYELRIFLDNPEADALTQPTAANGYAASLYVYGYGEPAPPGAREGEGARMPVTRTLPVTDAVRAVAARGPAATVTVTLVAVGADLAGVPLHLDEVRIALLVDAD